MENKFYLIQRGSFRNNLETATSFLGGSASHLIDPDYMGSSEFEWGAIPAAYSRIMGQFKDYKLFPSVISTIRGAPVCIFCRKDRRDDILRHIKEYIDNPYKLKEWSNLPQHFKEVSELERHSLKTNFWWCIDHTFQGDCESVGDWILFNGAKDRQKAFLRIINSDFSEWWSSMPDDVRKKRISDAWRR